MKNQHPDIVVGGGKKLKIGQIYQCSNSRKGVFDMRITKIYDEWITGIVTKGVAKAMMRYNVKDEGDEVTVRASHSLFIPIEI